MAIQWISIDVKWRVNCFSISHTHTHRCQGELLCSLSIYTLLVSIWNEMSITFRCVSCAIVPVAPILIYRSVAVDFVSEHRCVYFLSWSRSIDHGWCADWHVPFVWRMMEVSTWLWSAWRTSFRLLCMIYPFKQRFVVVVYRFSSGAEKMTHFFPEWIQKLIEIRESKTSTQNLWLWFWK